MQMVYMLPKGSCPRCAHRQFIVKEFTGNIYLTGRDGEVIDSKESSYVAIGKCLNCNAEYEMYPGIDSFVPLTPLRKILLEYDRSVLSKKLDDEKPIPNPFKE